MSGYPQHPAQPQPPPPPYGQPQPTYPGQPYPYPPQPSQPGQPPGNPFADQAINPYAAPVQPGYYPQPMKLAPYAGLWREGNVLVMHKLAPLPDICVKSNEPATGRLKRNLRWHHPAVYLTIFLHIFIYIVVAMVLSKTATIHIALTDEWLARRWRRMIFAWCLVLLGVPLFAISLMQIEQAVWAPFAMLGAILLFFGGAIYGLIACRLVAPKRMTDDYIWLKGVHPEFLNRLEPWPYAI
jgi:hypothetical protein